jgi:hypothetical protein
VQIGVEPDGTDDYLWTEVDAQVDGTSSRGNKIARFKFVDGQTLSNTSSAVTKYVLVSGQYNTTCNIDMARGYLIMRYHTAAGPRFGVYNLASVKAGGTTALCDVGQPVGLGNFQGFTSYGSYLYILAGDAYSATNPSPGNTVITVVDLNTGAVVDQQQTNAGTTLTYREPEGMSVLNYGTDHRLQFGFATGAAGARQASVYYKNVLIVGSEAEDLPYATGGATASLISDAAASGGAWASLGSTATGQYIEFITTTIPAGTYALELAYKTYSGRGKLQVTIDGTALGAQLDQYAAAQAYATASIGTVTFGSSGPHVIRLTVAGKNAASSGYLLSADAFKFILQ